VNDRIKGRENKRRASNLVSYAQPTIAVISGRTKEEVEEEEGDDSERQKKRKRAGKRQQKNHNDDNNQK